MNHYIHSFIAQWKLILPNLFNRKVIFSAIALVLVGSANPFSGKFLIPYLFGDTRVSPPDIVFRFIPYQDWAFLLPEVATILLTIFLIIYMFKNRAEKLDIYLQGFIILYLLRVIANLLTPLAEPPGILHEGLDKDRMTWDSGYFFSGHTAHFVLVTLYIWKFKILRIPAIITVVVGIISILIARHHYSIDIYGGIMTALVIYKYYVEPRITAKPKNLVAEK